jgi:hypothetical protein
MQEIHASAEYSKDWPKSQAGEQLQNLDLPDRFVMCVLFGCFGRP